MNNYIDLGIVKVLIECKKYNNMCKVLIDIEKKNQSHIIFFLLVYSWEKILLPEET